MKIPVFLLSATSLAAALPSVGPNYERPKVDAPSAYRDADDPTVWKTATPADTLSRGDWWKLFGDSTLNDLETRALSGNQDLRSAAARVEKARAAAGLARGAYWPQVAAQGSVVREQSSKTIDNTLPNTLTTTYRAPLVASWELDLFGRVRRLSESARAEADASVALFESVRLALTSEVASNYFTFGALTEEQRILSDTVGLRRRALDLANARLKIGNAAELDVARAETELAVAQAEFADIENRRSAVQNALAVLVGEPASSFTLSPPSARVVAPSLPSLLPSELVQRRPDVAAAERTVAAANARIGVAKAAFFPAISLTGSAGYASADVDRLFTADSRAWSIGPSIYLPIFQGGRNRANLERSRAAYDEAVATYRARVLTAFREVQDALSAARFLNEEIEAQNRAVASAQRSEQLAKVRYDAGYISYLELIDAQRSALGTQRAASQLGAMRLNASVALIKALGGGWASPLAGQSVAQK